MPNDVLLLLLILHSVAGICGTWELNRLHRICAELETRIEKLEGRKL